jgi:hypothetical protein
MDFVCELLTKLAIEYDIAVDASQHTRKGALVAGDSDNARVYREDYEDPIERKTCKGLRLDTSKRPG